MPLTYEREGGELRVNTTTTNHQYDSSAVALEGGGYVVVWTAYNQDSSNSWGIFGQVYDAAGIAVGSEMLVNTTTAGNQTLPSVAALNTGGYVITWLSSDQDGSAENVYTKVYDASGTAVGGETLVNIATAGLVGYPSVAALDGGGYVVTWESYAQDGSYDIHAQIFDFSMDRLGGEILVNSTTANNQMRASVASLNGGGFVITWNSNQQDGSAGGIYAQVYDAAGGAVGTEMLVNTTTANNQQSPSAAGLIGGGYVVTWQGYTDGSSYGVYARLFDATGTPIGGETTVNTTTANDQQSPSVAALHGGGYVVTWDSYEQDGSLFGVYAQVYNGMGTAIGAETLVNTTIFNHQAFSSVAALNGGGISLHGRRTTRMAAFTASTPSYSLLVRIRAPLATTMRSVPPATTRSTAMPATIISSARAATTSSLAATATTSWTAARATIRCRAAAGMTARSTPLHLLESPSICR